MSEIEIPLGLDGSTADKMTKLARLITAAQDQPEALRWTNKVLPGHLAAKKKEPIPIDQPTPTSQEGVSLRGPVV